MLVTVQLVENEYHRPVEGLSGLNTTHSQILYDAQLYTRVTHI